MAERVILVVVFDGFELLDLSGPASVFTTASELLGRPAYEVRVVSLSGGLVTSSAGVAVDSRPTRGLRVGDKHTVLVSGGGWHALHAAMHDPALLGWLGRACDRAGRYGSVCAGAVVLAETGRLDGQRATTHWAAIPHLRQARPAVQLAADALYVRAGRVWTSAGVATGIDMALAMVEADHGVAVMGDVAKRLVVYARRPGHQSQYSAVLDAQLEAGDALRDVASWIDAHLGEPLRVADLARRAHMSERTFYRRFTASLGKTPAKYVEDARMMRARDMLEDGAAVKRVAGAVGYRSEAAFRTAFRARFGVTPSLHRQLHG